ncbi:MAG: hypothetical protein AAF682_20980 [Planctomycetota bacterium]
MTTPHNPTHEARLRAVLLGELARDDPAVRALEESCATCRDELLELDAVAGTLDAAGAAEEAELAEVERTPPELDVAGMLAQIAAAEPYAAEPRTGLRPSAWVLIAAAAAAVVLAFVPGLLSDGGGVPDGAGGVPEPPQYLGDGDPPVAQLPRGEVDAVATFEWSYDPEHRHGFHVRVLDADDPLAGAVLEVRHWMETTWTPTSAELARLPQRLIWEVDALDAFGDVDVTSEPVHVTRR